MDGSDVDQKFARDSRVRQKDDAAFHADLPEHPRILFFQGRASAFEILENAIEFFPV
jgi:hypothetical protein